MTHIQYRNHDMIIQPVDANTQSVHICADDQEEWHYVEGTVAKAARHGICQIDLRADFDKIAMSDAHIQHNAHIADVLHDVGDDIMTIKVRTKKGDNPEQVWTDNTRVSNAVESAINHIDRFRKNI